MMGKFVIEADADLKTLRSVMLMLPPYVKVDRELILCKDCKYCKTIEPFPHPYCEARMFGKAVDPEFFCADGERK